MSNRMVLVLIFASIVVILVAVAISSIVRALSDRSSRRVASPQATTGPTSGPSYAFADEFEAPLDPAKWVTCHWWAEGGCTIATNNELEWYRPDEVFVHDGVLRLRAQRRRFTAPDGKAFPFTSGMISSGSDTDDGTPMRFAFQYGSLEVRARLPAGKGLWPALWLLPATRESVPEIDVLEVYGQSPSVVRMRLHPADGRESEDLGRTWDALPDPTGWHTLGLDWGAERLIWYVDGVERWRLEGDMVPREPMYLIANLAVGGEGPGPPNNSTPFPAYFDLDYVRVKGPATP